MVCFSRNIRNFCKIDPSFRFIKLILSLIKMICSYLTWRFARIMNVVKLKIHAIIESWTDCKFLNDLIDFAIMTNVWIHKSVDHYRRRDPTKGRIRLSYLLSLFTIITFIRFNGAAFVPTTQMVSLLLSPIHK